jgi:hypothetical protein
MTRYTKHLNTDYIIVDSSLEVNGVNIPIHIQVNINKIKDEDRPKIFRIVSIAFDRHFNFNKPQPTQKKPWWIFW